MKTKLDVLTCIFIYGSKRRGGGGGNAPSLKPCAVFQHIEPL